jgi:NAD(P)-dependent dehydrogenase (short-subunit alcohol dehydrogenase family)
VVKLRVLITGANRGLGLEFARQYAADGWEVIANAGTNHPMNAETAEDARAWQVMMMVNAIAPYVLGRALLPRVAEARGKMAAISSGMGSIAQNGGGWVPYRTSKAALNMAWRSLALDARPLGVTAVALSPGCVKTRMGGPYAEITTEESVSGMRALIGRLTIKDTGKFLRYDGQTEPW